MTAFTQRRYQVTIGIPCCVIGTGASMGEESISVKVDVDDGPFAFDRAKEKLEKVLSRLCSGDDD